MINWRYFLSSKVKRNSLANLARVILGLPLSVFFTYFVLKKLSLTDYGTWALAFSFFSYFSFADFGVSTAVTRFVSYHQARKEEKMINQIINTSFFFYLLSGLILLLILLVFKNFFLANFFKGATASFSLQSHVFTWIVIMGYLSFCLASFISALNGFQQMVLTNLADLLKTIIMTGFGFWLLNASPGLPSLVSAFVVSILVWAVVILAFTKSAFSNLSISWRHFDLKVLRSMLKFGIQTQFSSLAFFIHFNFDKIITGYFLGVEKVSYLDIALKIINQSRLLVSSLISPLLPAAAEKIVLYKDKISEFYDNSFRYVVLFSGLVFGGLFIFTPFLVRLWLGPGFEPAALATQILALGHFVNLCTGPAVSILMGQNNIRPLILASSAAVVANILFSMVGISLFGLYGAVAGTALALVLVDTIFLIIIPKYFPK